MSTSTSTSTSTSKSGTETDTETEMGPVTDTEDVMESEIEREMVKGRVRVLDNLARVNKVLRNTTEMERDLEWERTKVELMLRKCVKVMSEYSETTSVAAAQILEGKDPVW